ncbi:MAG TPA: radical SAM family heme chaperone HemW [Alphaproteobacteria bacterium]|nr:radical SAM family heme chaperone HemW [Alphaproteobacteria bacterium]
MERDLPQLGLYVHWPFCVAKCPYCDFNSHVRAAIDQPDWRAAYLRALETEAARLDAHDARRPLSSIFFGGGTPSLMEPTTAGAIIETAERLFGFEPGIEITLEANPSSVEAARFAAFKSAGVNRVSLGVQAFDDVSLKFLGRAHDAAQARGAIETALKTFERASFDLIYARPDQTLENWQRELDDALAYGTTHLSLYQLTIEKGTPFYAAHKRGEFVLPDEETAAALYEHTQARLKDAGLAAYEISNHAKPGEESRHNLIYWRLDDYVGIGPGAHGRLTFGGETLATLRKHKPEDWLAQLVKDGLGVMEESAVAKDERLSEMLMMGLRLAEPIPRARFLRIAGKEPEAALDQKRLQRLIEGGFLTIDERGLASTSEGRQRLNAVLAELII